MVTVGVLGATGRSGVFFVQFALEAGHNVVALVRSPEKVQIQHENLKVEKVDIYSKESLVSGFAGCDQIVSCLGAPFSLMDCNVRFFTETTKIITAALKQAGIGRFIMMSSAFARKSPNEPFFVWFFLRPMILGAVLRDLARTEDFLISDCPDLNFTVVKPPGLTMEPYKEQEILTRQGEEFVPGASTQMSRAQVAKFMVRMLETDSYRHQAVAIAVPVPDDKSQ